MITTRDHSLTTTAPPEEVPMYGHPVGQDVDYTMQTRWREADEQRLAARARRAPPPARERDRARPARGLGFRRRLGAWLVRAGYSLGATGPVR
jgi:hypothetical protein